MKLLFERKSLTFLKSRTPNELAMKFSKVKNIKANIILLNKFWSTKPIKVIDIKTTEIYIIISLFLNGIKYVFWEDIKYSIKLKNAEDKVAIAAPAIPNIGIKNWFINIFNIPVDILINAKKWVFLEISKPGVKIYNLERIQAGNKKIINLALG